MSHWIAFAGVGYFFMPNRILRDWTTSENIDRLSEGAELFFVRLIMKADDHGCFHANSKLLNAALFPLKDYKPSKIEEWLKECHKAGIIVIYGKYLQIINFGQRLRTMNSKFPLPDANALTNGGQVSDICPPETKRSRNEEEVETESEGIVSVWPSFDDFWDKYDKKQDRPKCELKWKKIQQEAREKIMHHLDIYIPSTPDKQYRKNPLTYLNSQSWENEVIRPAGKGLNLLTELEMITKHGNS